MNRSLHDQEKNLHHRCTWNWKVCFAVASHTRGRWKNLHQQPQKYFFVTAGSSFFQRPLVIPEGQRIRGIVFLQPKTVLLEWQGDQPRRSSFLMEVRSASFAWHPRPPRGTFGEQPHPSCPRAWLSASLWRPLGAQNALKVFRRCTFCNKISWTCNLGLVRVFTHRNCHFCSSAFFFVLRFYFAYCSGTFLVLLSHFGIVRRFHKFSFHVFQWPALFVNSTSRSLRRWKSWLMFCPVSIVFCRGIRISFISTFCLAGLSKTSTTAWREVCLHQLGSTRSVGGVFTPFV